MILFECMCYRLVCKVYIMTNFLLEKTYMCYDDVILVMMKVGCFIKRVLFLASPAVKKATDLQQ